MQPASRASIVLLVITSALLACGDDADTRDATDTTTVTEVTTTDATTTDTTTTDTTTTDATSTDATTTDATTTDATSTDATTTDATDVSADVVIPPPPDCGDGLLITREGASGDVWFRLERCMPMICGGGCPVSSPQLVITHAGRTDVATSDLIVYTKTHHNWLDSLVATLPDRKLLWRVEFDFEDGLVERHILAIEALDGSPILLETTIAIRPHG